MFEQQPKLLPYDLVGFKDKTFEGNRKRLSYRGIKCIVFLSNNTEGNRHRKRPSQFVTSGDQWQHDQRALPVLVAVLLL